jgi:hypothetical protein
VVKHADRGGSDRHFAQPDDLADRRHGRHHHHRYQKRPPGDLPVRTLAGPGASGSVPAAVLDAMKNLHGAVRLRLRQGPLDQTTTNAIATILDTVAQAVEAN